MVRPVVLKSIPKPSEPQALTIKKPLVVAEVAVIKTNIPKFVWPMLVGVCALLTMLFFMTLFAESKLTVSASVTSSEIHFSTEALGAFISEFLR